MSFRYHDTLRWHDLLPLRDMIDQKTASINDSYDLIFGDTGMKVGGRVCDTGVTDFSRQQCWVNAEALPAGKPTQQFVATVFLAAHERAHARWTDYEATDFHLLDRQGQPVTGRSGPAFDQMLHQTWNILEDERIERLVGRDFPHLHRYLKEGNGHLLSLVPAAGADDNPTHILTWVLRRRLFTRAGLTEDCPLSDQNQQLLATIEPLLEEAFGCDSSRRVVQIAREILKALQLDGASLAEALQQLLSGQQGHRGAGDEAESDGATAEEGELYASEAGGLQSEVEQLMSGTGYSPELRRSDKVPAAPYAALLSEVRPYVEPLRHLFQVPPTKRSVVFEESGARLSMRAYRRTPTTPFRVDSSPVRKGSIALSMVIDDSGSMYGRREQQAKLTALLCHEALQGSHRVRAVLAPTGRVICDRSHGEMSRAYIAGYDSASGTEYATVLAKEAEQLIKLGGSYTRYLILIADGVTGESDARKCAEIVKRLRKHKVHAIGIGLELPDSSRSVFEGIFGVSQYLAISEATELPDRMQAIMRRVARNQQRHGVAR